MIFAYELKHHSPEDELKHRLLRKERQPLREIARGEKPAYEDSESDRLRLSYFRFRRIAVPEPHAFSS